MFGKKKAKVKEKDRTIIGENEILKARSVLEKYKESKSDLEKRIVENDKWFKLRHWEVMKEKPSGEHIPPTSAWLFNSLLNKHADAMDTYPEPNVLPREESDKGTAQVLSEVLPVVFEQSDYEQTYSDTWWYKLKVGTSVTGEFWNSIANNGLGDIEIKKVDLLNLFWELGIAKIHDSKNVFLSPMMLDWARYWRTSPNYKNKSVFEYINRMNTQTEFASYYENAIKFYDFSEKLP